MRIRTLIEKWRKPGYGAEIKTICANELESLLPLWTVLTADPESWPELDPEYGLYEIEIIARFPKKDGSLGCIEASVFDEDAAESIERGDRLKYIGGIYRLVDDYDSPPKGASSMNKTSSIMQDMDEIKDLLKEMNPEIEDDADEESLDEIARRENHVIDKQESREI